MASSVHLPVCFNADRCADLVIAAAESKSIRMRLYITFFIDFIHFYMYKISKYQDITESTSKGRGLPFAYIFENADLSETDGGKHCNITLCSTLKIVKIVDDS